MKKRFNPSKMLEEAVISKDRYDIVSALVSYISVDRFFETTDFENALNFVLESGISEEWLFEPLDETILLENDSDKWNEDYYDEARANLRDNFSVQRLNHVRSVGKKLASFHLNTESMMKSANVVVTQNTHQNVSMTKYIIIGGIVIAIMFVVMMMK